MSVAVMPAGRRYGRDVVGVALSGTAFQDRAKHDEAVVAVAKPRAGLELQRLLDDPRQQASQRVGRWRAV
jgi:hypothetical protein